MTALIFGSGGLLGSALLRNCPAVYPTGQVPWHDDEGARTAITKTLADFQHQAGQGRWRILWVAGRAVTSSPVADADAERALFEHFCSALRTHIPSGPGAVFLASSAGGTYAGAPGSPYDEHTAPHPLSAYGSLKVAQEGILAAADIDAPVVIGRIANLYGPGQDLRKSQGLITRLAISATTREPLNLYVSLDTLRDFVYVDDAARTILDWMRVSELRDVSGTQLKVIASGSAVSLGHILRLTQRLARQRIPVSLGTDQAALAQSFDLRLRPSHHPAVRRADMTPLPVGIARVLEHVRVQRNRGHRTGS